MINKEYSLAVKYAKECVEKEPKNLEYQYILGQTYALNNQIPQAIGIFTDINLKRRGYTFYDLASCYSKLDNPDSALFFLEKHLESRYHKYESEIKLDPDFESLKSHSGWEKLWKKDWYSDYEHHLEDARYNIDIDNYELALYILDQILEKREKSHQAYYLRAQLYRKQKYTLNALDDIKEALEYRKTDESYYFFKAQILFELERYQKGLHEIDMAIVKNPYILDYYLLKSKLLNGAGDYEAAIELYSFYLNFVHITYDKLYYLGNMYFDNKNNIAALKNINKALSLNPNDKNLYYLRGKIYLASKLYKYAERDFTMYLDFDYQNGEVYFMRARARYQQENMKGACRDWQKARNLKYMEAEDFLRKHCVQ